MAMKPRLAVSFAMLCAAFALTAATARAQSIITEAAVTAGGSTDSLAAGAVQLRGFGDMPGGVSHIRTKSLRSADDSRSDFTGVDLRWTHGGVQLRGEWMTGRPFEGATTNGWYADAIVHLVAMGPVTAVARVERMGFQEPAE